MEKKIYVYENWSSDTPRKLGTLFIDSIRGGEHSSFQFDTAFLADACASQMLFVQSFSFIILLHLLFLIHPVYRFAGFRRHFHLRRTEAAFDGVATSDFPARNIGSCISSFIIRHLLSFIISTMLLGILDYGIVNFLML